MSDIMVEKEETKKTDNTMRMETPSSDQKEISENLTRFQRIMKNTLFRVLFVGFFLIVVQLVFSGYAVVGVLCVKDKKLDVWLVVFFRCLFAVPVSFLMAYFSDGGVSLKLRNYKKTELGFFTVLGCCATALNPIMYLTVINFLNGSLVSILAQLIPIFSTILSVVLQVEPLPSFRKLSTIIRLFGIIGGVSVATAIVTVNMVYNKKNDYNITKGLTHKEWGPGISVGFINNLVFSMYMVLQTKMFFKDPENNLNKKPFTINFLCTFFGSLVYFLIFLVYAIVNKFNFKFSIELFVSSAYSGILNTAVGFGVLMACIKYSSAMISSCMFCMNTVTSLLALRFIGKEQLGPIEYGLTPLLIIFGMLVVTSPLFTKFDPK